MVQVEAAVGVIENGAAKGFGIVRKRAIDRGQITGLIQDGAAGILNRFPLA